MNISRHNIARHELIGLSATLVESTNKDAVGLSGRIIDESRNTVTLECCGEEKKAVKHCSTFEFTLPNGDKIRAPGDIFVGRPEDRVTKNIRKWHDR